MTDFKDVDDALADLQGVLPVIKKASTGNAGGRATKYADLADICREVLPLTSERGLAWTTRPTLAITEEGKTELVLKYSLRHAASGTSIDGDYPLGTGGPQQLGSAITYARRYTFCAVTGVVADEDDDGHAAQQGETAKPRRESPPRRPAGELPKNADGSVSRSRTTDDELAATGQMTDAQIREHGRLEREVKGTGPQGTERLTTTPETDVWLLPPYEGPESPQAPVRTPRAAAPVDQRIVRHFARFGIEDRDVRLGYTALLAGRDHLGSTKDLTAVEGLAVEKALARCKDREALDQLLDGQARQQRRADKMAGIDG